jgi:hypothetical protein
MTDSHISPNPSPEGGNTRSYQSSSQEYNPFQYLFHYTTLQPSRIQNCVRARFRKPDETNLICNKGTTLEIFVIIFPVKQSKIDTVYLHQIPISNLILHPHLCPITEISVISPPQLPVELLCLLSVDYRLSVVAYNSQKSALDLLWSYKLVNLWENVSLPLTIHMQVHPSQEYIGILIEGSNTVKLVQFDFSSLSYDETNGCVNISENGLLWKFWNFVIPHDCVCGFIFRFEDKALEGKKPSTPIERVPPTAAPVNTPTNIGLAMPSPYSPHSPYSSLGVTPHYTPPSPGVLLNPNNPGSSPIVDPVHSPSSPYVAITSPGNLTFVQPPSKAKPLPSVPLELKLTREYISIVVLIVDKSCSSLRQLKSLKLYLISSQTGEGSLSQKCSDVYLIYAAHNRG